MNLGAAKETFPNPSIAKVEPTNVLLRKFTF
jgi:hypothetical protein